MDKIAKFWWPCNNIRSKPHPVGKSLPFFLKKLGQLTLWNRVKGEPISKLFVGISWLSVYGFSQKYDLSLWFYQKYCKTLICISLFLK